MIRRVDGERVTNEKLRDDCTTKATNVSRMTIERPMQRFSYYIISPDPRFTNCNKIHWTLDKVQSEWYRESEKRRNSRWFGFEGRRHARFAIERPMKKRRKDFVLLILAAQLRVSLASRVPLPCRFSSCTGSRRAGARFVAFIGLASTQGCNRLRP